MKVLLACAAITAVLLAVNIAAAVWVVALLN